MCVWPPQPEVIRVSQKAAQPEPPQSYYRSKPLNVPKHPGATTKINCMALTGRLLNAKERRTGMPDASPFVTAHSASRPPSSVASGRKGAAPDYAASSTSRGSRCVHSRAMAMEPTSSASFARVWLVLASSRAIANARAFRVGHMGRMRLQRSVAAGLT